MDNDPLFRPPPEGIERRPAAAAARLLLGGPVALLSSNWRGRHNVMPLAWHTPLSAHPPLIGVAIEQSRHTAEVVSHADEFALSFPDRALLHHVQYLGGLSGAQYDKLELTQLETFPAVHVSAPLIAGCVAWIECELREVIPVGDHLLFIGLPVAVQVNPQAFDDRWLLHEDGPQPLHYLGAQHYSQLRGVLTAHAPTHSEDPVRGLAERAEEELTLTAEARERREERIDALRREVQAGNLIDLASVDAGDAGTLREPAPPLRLLTPEPPGRPPERQS